MRLWLLLFGGSAALAIFAFIMWLAGSLSSIATGIASLRRRLRHQRLDRYWGESRAPGHGHGA